MKIPKGFSFPLIEVYIKEKTGQENISVYAGEVQDTLTDESACLVSYAPTPPLLKSGARKGKPNWKLIDKSKVKSVLITRSSLEECIKAWHERTGICPHCMGKGEVWTGWSIDSGHRYKPCTECGLEPKQQQVKLFEC